MKPIQVSLMAIVAIFMLASNVVRAEPVDFVLPNLKGEQVKLSDYRGKWVVVNYWATWCPPCRDEIPELVDFHDRHHQKDAVVLGVAMEDVSLEQLAEFADEMFISYPVLKTEPGPVSELGRVTALPTTFIVSPEGELVAWQEGGITAAHLDAFLLRKSQQQASAQ